MWYDQHDCFYFDMLGPGDDSLQFCGKVWLVSLDNLEYFWFDQQRLEIPHCIQRNSANPCCEMVCWFTVLLSSSHFPTTTWIVLQLNQKRNWAYAKKRSLKISVGRMPSILCTCIFPMFFYSNSLLTEAKNRQQYLYRWHLYCIGNLWRSGYTAR